jgi:hypothetical protein
MAMRRLPVSVSAFDGLEGLRRCVAIGKEEDCGSGPGEPSCAGGVAGVEYREDEEALLAFLRGFGMGRLEAARSSVGR